MKTCILTHSSLFGQKSGERWGGGGGGGWKGVCVFWECGNIFNHKGF